MKNQCKANEDGNCQHAVSTGTRSWTIPLGTHIIGGRTVSGTGSFSEVDTSHQKDTLEKDLLAILEPHKDEILSGEYTEDKFNELMQKFVIYIVNRDHKILNHGIDLGRKQNEQ
jgi:hypothetical protein